MASLKTIALFLRKREIEQEHESEVKSLVNCAMGVIFAKILLVFELSTNQSCLKLLLTCTIYIRCYRFTELARCNGKSTTANTKLL